MENLFTNISVILIVVAIICTVTSIITEITKDLGILRKIPTAIQVTITSILITVLGFIAYTQYKNIIITWYYIFAVIIVGIVIGYITMFGWDNLIKNFKKFYKKTDEFK